MICQLRIHVEWRQLAHIFKHSFELIHLETWWMVFGHGFTRAVALLCYLHSVFGEWHDERNSHRETTCRFVIKKLCMRYNVLHLRWRYFQLDSAIFSQKNSFRRTSKYRALVPYVTSLVYQSLYLEIIITIQSPTLGVYAWDCYWVQFICTYVLQQSGPIRPSHWVRCLCMFPPASVFG